MQALLEDALPSGAEPGLGSEAAGVTLEGTHEHKRAALPAATPEVPAGPAVGLQLQSQWAHAVTPAAAAAAARGAAAAQQLHWLEQAAGHCAAVLATMDATGAVGPVGNGSRAEGAAGKGAAKGGGCKGRGPARLEGDRQQMRDQGRGPLRPVD